MSAVERLVFLGTPAFAVPTLSALIAAGRAPHLVVSQPARPQGRGHEVRQPPVALAAREHDLPLAQPPRLSVAGFRESLEEVAPDLAIVVAYGRLLPPWLLTLPRLGCVNLHASLLPRWRGAAPIQAALAAGDPETGVTTMQMDAGLDTGDLLLRRTTPIGVDERAPELAARLAVLGAALVVETVEGLEQGRLHARPQDEEQATHAPRLERGDGDVDWSLPAHRIHDRWRAHHPWPGTQARWRGATVKLLELTVAPGRGDAEPGTVLAVSEAGIEVATGDGGRLLLRRLQRPGRADLDGATWARGERLAVGDRFS